MWLCPSVLMLVWRYCGTAPVMCSVQGCVYALDYARHRTERYRIRVLLIVSGRELKWQQKCRNMSEKSWNKI
jgi:hypothetical protein